VGRIRSVAGEALLLDDTVADCIRFGDEWSARLRTLVDRMIEASGVPLPPMEGDPVDEPHPDPYSVRSPERLDLDRLDIRTVIWATGVGGRFDWLPPGVLGADGTPGHRMGTTGLPGLFVLGFPWLVRRGSGIIHGADADSSRIVDTVIARAG
jgi:putative flavoprotein involved in K+ transport